MQRLCWRGRHSTLFREICDQMTKIKICGITNLQDATWAANLGVDYLGLNFFKDSPRKISEPMAKKIIAGLPPYVLPVGIFVNGETKKVIKIAKRCNFNIVQLHGQEDKEYCRQLKEANLKIIKVFRLGNDPGIVLPLEEYQDVAEFFLFDTFVPEELGGSGQSFNWDILTKEKLNIKPTFVSGGLNADNVGKLLEKVQPYGVDVCSGVERLPRRKDYEKMHQFVLAVRGKKR